MLASLNFMVLKRSATAIGLSTISVTMFEMCSTRLPAHLIESKTTWLFDFFLNKIDVS